MPGITVFADVSCPFAHVGLTRISAYRAGLGPGAPPLHVRAWPLEVVNGAPLTGPAIEPKVDALRRGVAPDLFRGFDPGHFPTTTLPALAAEVAAYRAGSDAGLRCALELRRALFERGLDIGDPAVVAGVSTQLGLPGAGPDDLSAILQDHAEGVERGVEGSPHFFTDNGDFFCPTLDIRHDDGRYDIGFDTAGFERFIAAAFNPA